VNNECVDLECGTNCAPLAGSNDFDDLIGKCCFDDTGANLCAPGANNQREWCGGTNIPCGPDDYTNGGGGDVLGDCGLCVSNCGVNSVNQVSAYFGFEAVLTPFQLNGITAAGNACPETLVCCGSNPSFQGQTYEGGAYIKSSSYLADTNLNTVRPPTGATPSGRCDYGTIGDLTTWIACRTSPEIAPGGCSILGLAYSTV